MNLGRLRDSETSEAPLYYEQLRVRPPAAPLAWLSGALVAGIGLVMAGLRPHPLVYLCGGLLACAGGLVLLGMIRCRHLDVVLTRHWLVLECGPLQSRLPLAAVKGSVTRPAAEWRRLFADVEVALSLAGSWGERVVPSSRPDELVATLGELVADEDQGETRSGSETGASEGVQVDSDTGHDQVDAETDTI